MTETTAPKSLAPQVSDKSSALAGVPLGIVGVMILEAHTGKALESWQAAAFGSVFAAIAGYIGHVLVTLIDRWVRKQTED